MPTQQIRCESNEQVKIVRAVGIIGLCVTLTPASGEQWPGCDTLV